MSDRTRELTDLLSALCDQRLTDGDRARLEELVLTDREALRFYLRFIQLHGLLHWDAAGGTMDASLVAEPFAQDSHAPTPQASRIEPVRPARRLVERRGLVSIATALCLLVGWFAFRPHSGDAPGLAHVPPHSTTIPSQAPDASAEATAPALPDHALRLPHAPPLTADAARTTPAEPAPETSRTPAPTIKRPPESMVALIDEALDDHWREHEVVPAHLADDAAWARRVHLDLIGRIPEAPVVSAFLADKRADKRARLVDELLDSPEFARHYSVVWTNLLIGHTSPREVNRPALEKFLREQFHHNRPWSETIARLVSAEGYEDEDGASNFLLAHLNNEAVPATAVTARVLLCEQLQCTQCHNHPYVDWTQDRFWRLNAFFQQTEIVRHARTDAKTGRRVRDRLELVSIPSGGPTFYEDRQSRMNVAYPQFAGIDVSPAAEVDRRDELARLMCEGDQPQAARAFVNRLWGKLFGYGFTNPIDDMGPHNQPVLPELFDALTAGFVRTGFDVKELVRCICLSRPYQLASTLDAGNSVDTPEDGSIPLFSRAYARPLSAEQLFDSLLTATQADRAGAGYWDEVESRRRKWMEQFYTALDNDENSEEDAFEGSLAQTLVMMNGDLIQQATTLRPGTVLQQILSRDIPEEDKIRQLSLATLSRPPSSQELASLRRVLRQQINMRPRDTAPQAAQQEAFRDLMWAYLNSTEFRLNF